MGWKKYFRKRTRKGNTERSTADSNADEKESEKAPEEVDEKVENELNTEESEDEEEIAKKNVRRAARKILRTADFWELTDGYYYTEKCEQDEIGNYNKAKKKVKEKWINMNQPRSCSYNSTHAYNWDIGKVVTDTTTLGRLSPNNLTIPKVEQRGITLRQLRAVMATIVRRCKEESWTDLKGNALTPETVSFYDVDTYVVRPFTVKKSQSFVTCLPSTAGSQPPRFAVSHCWGQSVSDFIKCLEQCVLDFARNDNGYGDQNRRGGGMTVDTPIWIYAFANNHWGLDSNEPNEPKDSGFVKALKIAQGRIIAILDKNGVIFSRAWCLYEFYLTLLYQQQEEQKEEGSKVGLWAIYAAEGHTYESPIGYKEEREAVGIIYGGATSDGDDTRHIIAREQSFPFNLIKKSFAIKVEDAYVSNDPDRIRILDSIAFNSGSELNDAPVESHEKYTDLNYMLQAHFATSEVVQRVAAEKNDEEWMEILVAMSKGTSREQVVLDFGAHGTWSDLNVTRASQLVAYLPLSMDGLVIRDAKFGPEFIETLTNKIKALTNLHLLTIGDTLVTGEVKVHDAGLHLAQALASNCTINKLNMYNTNLISTSNVAQWTDAFINNVPLTTVSLHQVDKGIEEELRVIKTEHVPNFYINA